MATDHMTTLAERMHRGEAEAFREYRALRREETMPVPTKDPNKQMTPEHGERVLQDLKALSETDTGEGFVGGICQQTEAYIRGLQASLAGCLEYVRTYAEAKGLDIRTDEGVAPIIRAVMIAKYEDEVALQKRAMPEGWEPLDLVHREKKLKILSICTDWEAPKYWVSMGSTGIRPQERAAAGRDMVDDWQVAIRAAESAESGGDHASEDR